MSSSALASAEAAEANMKAQIAALAVRLGETRLEAPIDGVVAVRRLDPGALVGPAAAASNSPMLRLEQNSRLRLVVAVPGGITEVEQSAVQEAGHADVHSIHIVPPEQLLKELMIGTQAMQQNAGQGRTNEDVFAAHFYPALGLERAALEPLLQRFYVEEFPKLSGLTRRLPGARELVAWACAQGLQVVVATNPLFPRLAIEHRLSWAGVPVSEFPYALVTSYETMHATKSSPDYYSEIAERLVRRPAECLMAGDDWVYDMQPAAAAGMPVFWIADPAAAAPEPQPALAGQGRLEDLLATVQATLQA